MAKLDRFDPLIPADPWVNPWQPDGSFVVDQVMLRTLLGAAVGTSRPPEPSLPPLTSGQLKNCDVPASTRRGVAPANVTACPAARCP